MSTPDQPTDSNRAAGPPRSPERQPPPLPPRPLPKTAPQNPQRPSGSGPHGGQPHPGAPAQPPTQAMPWVAQSARPHSPPSQAAPAQAGPGTPDRPEQPHAPKHQGPRTQGSPTAQGQNGHPQAPPWQRGATKEPQREPQSNLHRPGEAPVKGRPAAGASNLTATAASAAEAQAAAKSLRKEAANARSTAIDGPTRSIARPELAKDMPDLSDVRHPIPVEQPPRQRTGPTAAASAPQEVAEGTPLRATVQIRRIDPWSMLKVSFALSIAMFFVWMVAVALLYVVLDGMGVWDRLNTSFTQIVSESSSDGLVSSGQVFGYASVIGVINVVLFTALATIGSFIYNQCSDLVGGVEVTLADRD